MNTIVPAFFVCLAAATTAVAAQVGGTVTDLRTGQPLVGARVELVETGATIAAGADGAFSIAAPATGALTVVVSHPGYRVKRVALVAPPTQPLAVELEPIVSFSDRIEVTATRAREGTDPATFTNIPAERVEEAYWGQDPAMLLAATAPGFFAYNDNGNGIGYSYFTIRGFGQARTRVTLNGAPLNDAESGELFFIDLADFLFTAGDVQVQRGVFGLSGIGGALDITTAPPAAARSFTIHAGAGSFDTRRFAVRWESGLIDGAWQVAARYSKITTEGYRDQSWVDMWNYYVALARLGERSSTRLVLFGGPEQTHLAYLGVARSTLEGGLTGDPDRDRRFNPLTFPGEIDNFYQPHIQLLHDLQVADHSRLSQAIYFFRGDGYYEQFKEDRDLFEYDLPDVVLPDGTVVTTTDLVRRRTVDEWDGGWVPELTHEAGPWTVTLGGELRLHHAHHFGDVRWAEHFPAGVEPNHRYYDYEVDKQTYALAATARWQVTPRLALTGGLEGAYHRYEMSEDRLKNVAFSETFDFLLPRLGALWSVSPAADLYVSVARGMREPAFRTIYDPQDYYGQRVSLDPEDVWDLEAGVSLRETGWRARANLFYMKFDNEIVYAGALDDSGVPIYGNGARSLHRGVELDATWQPSERLGVDGALTFSRNTFTDYGELWAPGVEVAYDGNRIAGYPDVLASLAVRGHAGALAWALTGRHAGKIYVDNTEDNRRDPEARNEPGYVPRINPSFTLLGAQARVALPQRWTAALDLDRIELEARIENLLDETYTAFGYMDYEPQFIPAAGRTFYFGITLGL